jgi:hypothetical protein
VAGAAVEEKAAQDAMVVGLHGQQLQIKPILGIQTDWPFGF